VAGNSLASPNPSLAGKFFDNWNYGFNLAWEIDFWGRLRRAITAGEDNLDASVANYDQAVVTMLGDIAQNYVEVRTDQEEIKYLRLNAEDQHKVFNYYDARRTAGYKVTNVDWGQALQLWQQTEAQIPPLEIDARQASNRLCTLLGIPASDMQCLLGTGPIPTAPATVAIGIPAELVRRRPDVRQAERLAAAQAEQIGIAEAQLYPIFSITGVLNWQATSFKDLFTSNALNGNVGPQFQWNLLNYGRIHNNVIFQDATFKQLVVAYQATVLQASQDVENGIVTFLKAQVQTKLLQESVRGADVALKAGTAQFKVGEVDVNRYATIEQALVTEQNALAQAQGQIAQGLILIYRGLGGGWEIRCQPGPTTPPLPTLPPNPLETPNAQPGAPAGAPNQVPEEIPAPVPPPNSQEMPKEQPALPANPAGKLPQATPIPVAPSPDMIPDLPVS
jgi:NodT family efflux transporter outer membrane factor (OMF) lipoprotein